MRRYVLVPLLLSFLGVASCAALKPAPVAPTAPSSPATAPLPPASTRPAPPPSAPLSAEPVPAPAEQPFFTQQGIASFYGKAHQGRRTATGERFDMTDFTAAHRTLPFGTVVRVTNLKNGKTVRARINDRGPHVKGRVIDLSMAAARSLGIRDGLAHVRLDVFRSDQREGDFPP
jgi:rare lipoprotein A